MKSRQIVGNFTLVELLVVISIIALLASLLLPALNKSKKMSLAIACTNNLKQIGAGIEMYASDYDSWLPVATKNDAMWNYNAAWKNETGPYVIGDKAIVTGNPNVPSCWCTGTYLCPSFQMPTEYTGVANGARKGGYGWNYAFAGYLEGDATRPRKRQVEMRKPSLTVLCGDAEASDFTPPLDAANWGFLFYPSSGRVLGLRHQKGINIVWGDMHVAKMPRGDIVNNGMVDGIQNYYFLFDK